MGMYARKTFGMFTGRETRVRLRFENALAGAVMDRLGQNVMMVPDGQAHFTLQAEVVISPQFFAWICGFGGRVKILGPESVVEEMKQHVRTIADLYEI